MSNPDLAKTLIDRLAKAGYEPYDYSGRAMYGERCVAIDLDSSAALLRVGMDLVRDEEGAEEFFDGPDSLTNVFTDSMGRGIVAYWRYVTWPAGYSPPITREKLREIVEEEYPDGALRVLELCCLSDEDLEKGRDHCLDRLNGALEEEMGHG